MISANIATRARQKIPAQTRTVDPIRGLPSRCLSGHFIRRCCTGDSGRDTGTPSPQL